MCEHLSVCVLMLSVFVFIFGHPPLTVIPVQIASALAFIHKNDIIYRDLKPSNILMFSLSSLEKVHV